jgi:hypothetical protein
LRSIREDHDTLNVRHQVFSWHLVHLQVNDDCRGGGWRSQDAASGPALEHLAPAPSSTAGDVYAGLDPFARQYTHNAKLVWGILIVMFILWSFIGASSSSSSASSLNQDSSDDYPEIRIRAYGNSAEDIHLILMVAPNGDQFRNSSTRYPTIGRLKESDAQTPSVGLVRNLNPDFNDVRVQAIMETI